MGRTDGGGGWDEEKQARGERRRCEPLTDVREDENLENRSPKRGEDAGEGAW